MSALRLWVIFALMLFMVTCKQRKAVIAAKNANLPPNIGIWEAPVKAPDSIYLHFQMLETTLFSDSVVFKLKYGGGCIKPHVFQCYTSGMKDEGGIMDIYLSHLTLDDRCKALVLTKRTYFLGYLLKSGDQIRINGGPVMTLPKKPKRP